MYSTAGGCYECCYALNMVKVLVSNEQIAEFGTFGQVFSDPTLETKRGIDGYILVATLYQIAVACAGATRVYLNISAHGSY